MRTPDVRIASSGVMGRWTVSARTVIDGTFRSLDITTFRDAPTGIDNLAWTDPFGPSTATLSFPSISPMEMVPGSDTWWLREGTQIDISLHVENAETVDAMRALGVDPTITWEGFIESRNWSISADSRLVTVECLGAMRILDSRVAQKIVFSRPAPYEWVIGRHFTHAESLHPTNMAPMAIEWPSWWNRLYRYDASLPNYLQPSHVIDGYPWTGMTSRDFGRWDPVLSSAIQGLLSVMFSERGQFTLMLDQGRRPVLRHRDHLFADDDRTLVLDAAWPGVSVDIKEDYSQTANVVYGEASSGISGAAYRGLRYSVNGGASMYDPFEEHGAVSSASPVRDTSAIRRELYITFSEGMQPSEAIEKSRIHIMRNADPGYVGSVTLNGADPLVMHPDGEMVPYPALGIRAGDTVRVSGLFGTQEGVRFHVSAVTSNLSSNSVTLNVDSKFRDWMTVREIMDRGKDALRPWHMMTVGKYSINIKDAMLQWNYAEGSGYVPLESKGLWDGAPEWEAFPWETWTKAHPPSIAPWTSHYIKVPALTFDQQGFVVDGGGWNRPVFLDTDKNCHVLLSQAGDAALFQIAAYNADGSIKRVPFHVSIWHSNGASGKSSPLTHSDLTVTYTDWTGTANVQRTAKYKDGSRYPFFENAWEQFQSDGRQGSWLSDLQPSQDGLIVGYGNHWEKAGYWPETGRTESNDLSYPDENLTVAKPTGMLVDESGWSYDFSSYENFSLNDPTSNSLLEHANATILIFCESLTDTYFLGRVFRKEYGL